MRVYDLAKEQGANSKELVIALRAAGIEVKSYMSSLTPEQVELFKRKTGPATKVTLTEAAPVKTAPQPSPDDKIIDLPEKPTARIIAELTNQKSNKIIKKLMEKGMFSLTQVIDHDTARWVVESFGFSLRKHLKADVSPVSRPSQVPARPARKAADEHIKKQPRPPVVTIMGHVDHGKTSLLDALRDANVCAGEAGGITQHIGAYKVKTEQGEVAFIDTPGHEAFTAMRARGAKVTDIVILVVAADDGVKQQTEEAINHAKDAGVPIIVAVNKIDKPEANQEKVKQELSNFDLIPEDWGGKTIFVEVSALKQTGLKELLEMIILEAEMLELKAVPSGPAAGVIVESKLDPGRGAVATVLVRSGVLRVGDAFICGVQSGKVRAMFDERHKPVKSASPSTPVEVLGFSGVPEAGDDFEVVSNEREAIAIVQERLHFQNQERLASKGDAVFSLEDLTRAAAEGETKELKIIVKGDVNGSVEAVADSLLKLSNADHQVKVNIIHKAVGAIIEADVMLAAASNAVIIGFNVRPQAKAKKLAENHGVRMKLDTVIYNLVSDIDKALKGMAAPVYKESVIGMAEIREVFSMPKIGSVAGSFISEGKMLRNCNVRLLRDNVVVYTGTINSIRRFKDDVKEVGSGYECGIKLENFIDYKTGDILEAYSLEEENRL
ncbi:MAG: translation initiation factor IF-2 [bacterium]